NTHDFSNLPRKYKISVSGCCIRCPQPDINCAALIGVKRSDEAGYALMIGGGLSASPHLAKIVPRFVRPDQAWTVIKAVSEIFRDDGYRLKRTRARFKFLVDDWWKAGGGEGEGNEYLAEKVEERLGFKLDAFNDFPVIKDQEADHLGIHA